MAVGVIARQQRPRAVEIGRAHAMGLPVHVADANKCASRTTVGRERRTWGGDNRSCRRRRLRAMRFRGGCQHRGGFDRRRRVRCRVGVRCGRRTRCRRHHRSGQAPRHGIEFGAGLGRRGDERIGRRRQRRFRGTGLGRCARHRNVIGRSRRRCDVSRRQFQRLRRHGRPDQRWRLLRTRRHRRRSRRRRHHRVGPVTSQRRRCGRARRAQGGIFGLDPLAPLHQHLIAQLAHRARRQAVRRHQLLGPRQRTTLGQRRQVIAHARHRVRIGTDRRARGRRKQVFTDPSIAARLRSRRG